MKPILVSAAACLLLAACEGPPRHYDYGPPPQGGDVYGQMQPYAQKPMPPVNAEPEPAAPPPRVTSAGPLKTAMIGSYMDNQESELRRALHGMGVLVARRGDDIVLNLRSDEVFEGHGFTLSGDAQRILSAVAPVLRHFDHTSVVIGGYTDTTGSPEQNMIVSRKRAYTVGGQLVKDAVPLSRLQAMGFGETNLKVKTGDQVNEPRNRRIEIRISARAAG